jgi:hypothetical protein
MSSWGLALTAPAVPVPPHVPCCARAKVPVTKLLAPSRKWRIAENGAQTFGALRAEWSRTGCLAPVSCRRVPASCEAGPETPLFETPSAFEWTRPNCRPLAHPLEGWRGKRWGERTRHARERRRHPDAAMSEPPADAALGDGGRPVEADPGQGEAANPLSCKSSGLARKWATGTAEAGKAYLSITGALLNPDRSPSLKENSLWPAKE